MSGRPEVPFAPVSYLRDRAWAVILGVFCVAFLAFMLGVLGLGPHAIFVCAAFVTLCLATMLAWGYLRRRRWYRELDDVLGSLEHAYYLAELMGRPAFLEGKVLLEACDAVCRADTADIAAQRERAEVLARFVDMWTHEIKTPLAAARLTLARMRGPEAMALRKDVERIELACERALFSLRTSSLSRDYRIVETPLAQVCRESIKSLANLLIDSGVGVQVDIGVQVRVQTDASWLRFVLRQVLSNAAQYGACTVGFSVAEGPAALGLDGVVLQVCDDGAGVPSDEVPHVFDRGYSGTNGRNEGTSTGYGLFLAAEVCREMGLGLTFASEEGRG